MKIMLNYTLCICQNIKGMLIEIIQMIISKAIKSVTDTLDIEFVDIGKEIFEKAEDLEFYFHLEKVDIIMRKVIVELQKN